MFVTYLSRLAKSASKILNVSPLENYGVFNRFSEEARNNIVFEFRSNYNKHFCWRAMLLKDFILYEMSYVTEGFHINYIRLQTYYTHHLRKAMYRMIQKICNYIISLSTIKIRFFMNHPVLKIKSWFPPKVR